MAATSDSGDTHDPTQLREEVEAELDEMVEEETEAEAKRMAERDEVGVDEPS